MKSKLKYAALLGYIVLVAPLTIIPIVALHAAIGVLGWITDIFDSIRYPEETKLYSWMGWK